MTVFIETDEDYEKRLDEAGVPRPGTTVTRRKRPTTVNYDASQEDDVLRLPVPSPGQTNPDIWGLEFIPRGGEAWNFSYQPLILQLQNFRLPGDIDTRYDLRVPPLSYLTFPFPYQYARNMKLGYKVLGLHTGMPGVITLVVTIQPRAFRGGSLLEGLSTAFDVYEADVPADGAFHIVQFTEPVVGVEIDSMPAGPLPANTAQMLSVQTTADPNGLTSGSGAPNWEPAFTLGQGAAAGLLGGSKSYNGLVTAVNVKNLGAVAGRYSIQGLI